MAQPALRLAAAALLLAGLACESLMGPHPPVAWDPSPDAVILSGTFCCGYAPAWVSENYIPDVQLWGDGRIQWDERNNNGGQRVLRGKLTPDQMTALLQKFVDAGFFGWEDSYGDFGVTDGAAQCLTLTLLSRGKQVCEYFSGAPEDFHKLYAAAASGGGAPGEEVTPTQGYVTVYPQYYTVPPTGDDYLTWPADSLGMSLVDHAGGQWLDGPALAFAWRVVTGDTWQPLVREGELYYMLTVIVPGVSQMDPPTPPPATE